MSDSLTKPPMLVHTAYLHAPIMIAGKTEATLSPEKFRGIKMEWIEGPFLKITAGDKVHVLPAAAVKDSILLIESDNKKKH